MMGEVLTYTGSGLKIGEVIKLPKLWMTYNPPLGIRETYIVITVCFKL